MIGPDVEPATPHDPLKHLVDALAITLGIVAGSLALAEWVWRQVRPS